MTVAAAQTAERPLADWGRALPSGSADPSWLRAFREAASAVLAAGGLPQAGDDSWKHMGLGPVLDPSWSALPDHCRTDVPAGSDIRVRAWTDSVRLPDAALRPSGAGRPLAHLNAMLFHQAVDIRVGKNTCALQPLRLTPEPRPSEAARASAVMIHPRASVTLDPGSRLDMILDCRAFAGDAEALVNLVLDIELHEQTALNLVLIGPSAARSVYLSDIAVRQHRDSVFRAFCFETRPHLSRIDLSVSLEGANASTDLFGLALLGGPSRAFHHLNVDHRVPHTQSQQVFKSILAGSARFEYDSLVSIRPEAPHSSSEQLNKNLVLSDDARAYARPQLAIHTDEVQCHHGATVGQMNLEELLYLRTRGIDPVSASALVLRGFVDDLLKEIPVGAAVQELQKRAHERLQEIAR